MLTEELSRFAEDWYVAASPEDRSLIDAIVADLCESPEFDNVKVFAFSRPPAILSLYKDEQFFIVFTRNSTALQIMGIGKAGDEVSFGQRGRAPTR